MAKIMKISIFWCMGVWRGMVRYKCTGVSEDLHQQQNHRAIQYNIIRAGA